MKKTNSRFTSLCIKEITNNINEIEKKELDNFLKENNNKIEYKKLKEAWNFASPVKLKYEISEEEEWNKINSAIAEESFNNKTDSNRFSKILDSIFLPKIKAAIGTAIIIITAALLLLNISNTEQVIKTINTSNNEKLEIVLADGSIVNLNSGSKLEYYENFEEDKREVKLEGEAFFSVKKDGRPFIINTKNAITKVLGTKFNIWARAEETRVIVKEGKVSLAENVNNNEVILTKDELSKVIKNNKPIEPVKIDSEYMLGWLNGKIVFNNTPLSEITKELERNYNIKIELASPEINEISLTGTFENEKIDTVLTKICLALSLKYSEHDNVYKVSK